MAAKGYCLAGQVADQLGKTFDTAEVAQCDRIIERVEAHIDAVTGRAWLIGAQTAEIHYINSRTIYTNQRPLASVQSITGRSGLGEAEITLVVDIDYEIRDLATGEIRIIYAGSYDRVLISYTPVDTVPADLLQATIDTVAAWMMPSLRPDSYGLDSYTLPDLSVKFSRAHVQGIVPPLANDVIERHSNVFTE